MKNEKKEGCGEDLSFISERFKNIVGDLGISFVDKIREDVEADVRRRIEQTLQGQSSAEDEVEGSIANFVTVILAGTKKKEIKKTVEVLVSFLTDDYVESIMAELLREGDDASHKARVKRLLELVGACNEASSTFLGRIEKAGQKVDELIEAIEKFGELGNVLGALRAIRQDLDVKAREIAVDF